MLNCEMYIEFNDERHFSDIIPKDLIINIFIIIIITFYLLVY